MQTETTRRAFLGGAGVATVALAVPVRAMTATHSEFSIAAARYHAAGKRFNALPSHLETSDPAAFAREEELYLEAVNAVDSAPCLTWEEFGEAFRIACDDGYSVPPEPLLMKLLADTKRLSAKGGVA